MTAIQRNIRKNNPKKKPNEVFDLVENDIPVPEEYQYMNPDILIDGITANEIPIVFLEFNSSIASGEVRDSDLDFTLYQPGKQPIPYYYNEKSPKWPMFLKRLNKIGQDAKRDRYPVLVSSVWPFIHSLEKVRKPETLAKKKTCVWCGNITDIPAFKPNGKYNRPKAFCCNDCKCKYQNYKYLLRTLVKDGKITAFEKELRLNPAYSVIEDTLNNSYLMIQELLLGCYSDEEFEELQEKEELPLVSDKKFVVSPDNTVVFDDEDRVCKKCGAPISGHRRREFCSDKCRFDWHNEQKKKLRK